MGGKTYKPEIGDVVAIRWKDHYRFKGEQPHEPLMVTSWGKIHSINEDGIAIIQNEVEPNNYGIDPIMDGQFCLKNVIIEIKKL